MDAKQARAASAECRTAGVVETWENLIAPQIERETARGMFISWSEDCVSVSDNSETGGAQ